MPIMLARVFNNGDCEFRRVTGIPHGVPVIAEPDRSDLNHTEIWDDKGYLANAPVGGRIEIADYDIGDCPWCG